MDIGTVSSIVGNASPNTTARYDCQGEKAKAGTLREVSDVRPNLMGNWN